MVYRKKTSPMCAGLIGIIEKGQANISLKVFLKLCKGLNENPADILKEVDLAYLEKAEL